MNEKLTGSFYTPEPLAKHMVDYVFRERKFKNVLEPSVGDGRFLDELIKYNKNIDAVEIEAQKIASLEEQKLIDKDFSPNLICSDFIDYALLKGKKYDLIIGNPPYIRKHNLSEIDREKGLLISRYFSLPDSVSQNIWVSFVLASLKMLKEDGVIFFVLPFEFLQVQYAQVLRKFLESQFNTIEITTFHEKVFKDIEQDVCLVYMTNIKNAKPIIKYTTFNNCEDMKVVHDSYICRHKPLEKWSNAILSDTETTLIKELSKKYMKINELGFISPGIVIGANSYFILSVDEAKLKNCEHFCLPVLSKVANFSKSLIFKDQDLEKMREYNTPHMLLNLTNVNEENFSSKLKQYIEYGVNEDLNKRYKCSLRTRWYDVPIISNGDLLFFKRFNHYPTFIVNDVGIYSTDVAYNVRLKKEFDKYSVAFCFYNSLTITMCEYIGRFYGGGINELVPSEFKQLCLPYKDIPHKYVKKLDEMIRCKKNIDEITDFVDSVVFANIELSELQILKSIRQKYITRRFKINN